MNIQEIYKNIQPKNLELYLLSKESFDNKYTIIFLKKKSKELNILKKWFNNVGDDVHIDKITDKLFNEKEANTCLDIFGNIIELHMKHILLENIPKIVEKIEFDNYINNLKKVCGTFKLENNKEESNNFDKDSYYLVYNKEYLTSFIIENPNEVIYNLLKNKIGNFELYHNFKKKYFKKSLMKINSILNSEHDSEESLKETINFINNKYNKDTNSVNNIDKLIKDYIKENYKICDNINNKLSASYICSEIEDHLLKLKKENKLLKDFVKGKVKFRNNLSKLLISLSLKKKRFQNGFYYYGLKRISYTEKNSKTSSKYNILSIDNNNIVDKLDTNDYDYINTFNGLIVPFMYLKEKIFLDNIKSKWNGLAVKIDKYINSLTFGSDIKIIKNIFKKLKIEYFSFIVKDEMSLKNLEYDFKYNEFFCSKEDTFPTQTNIICKEKSNFTTYKFQNYYKNKGNLLRLRRIELKEDFEKKLELTWFNYSDIQLVNKKIKSGILNTSEEFSPKYNFSITSEELISISSEKSKSNYSSYSETECSDNEKSLQDNNKLLLNDSEEDILTVNSEESTISDESRISIAKIFNKKINI
jgi:hypothetical protein